MHRSPTLGKSLLIILLLSAAFRIGYLTVGDIVPVMWDARRYAAAAIGMISYVDDSGPALTATGDEEERRRQDRYRFKHYYEKYLQGEQIEWLYYSPHTLTEARDDIFFSGPVYPFILAVSFFFSPAADLTVARSIGIIFDLLANLLLILVAIRLVGRSAALIAGLIYAFYFPFVYSSTLLLLETSTSMLLLLTIYLIMRGVEDDRRWHYILAGIVSGLLIMNKPTAMLLSVPVLLGFIAYTWNRLSGRILIQRNMLFAVPLILIFSGWTAVTSVKYGQLAVRDPSYGISNLRQSTSIEYEGYDLDKVEKDFWTRSITGDISDNPVGFAGLLSKKFYRLWSQPYNPYQRSFLVPLKVDQLIHYGLILLGLSGLMIMLATNWRKASWPLLIIGYYTSIHIIFHSISRYNFNAMPMVVITAASLLWLLYETITGENKKNIRLVILAVGFAFLAWLIDYNWLNTVLGTGLDKSIVTAVLAAKTLIALFAIYLIVKIFVQSGKNYLRYTISLAIVLIIALPGWTSILARDDWAEFSTRLDTPLMKAGTKIFISKPPRVTKDETLALLIDLNSGKDRHNTFTVTIGDSTVNLLGGAKPLTDYFYPKPSYLAYSSLLPIGIEEFRQYAIIPLSFKFVSGQISKAGALDISVAINQRFIEPNNYVDLYGSFAAGKKKQILPGIRFTSIERFVFKGDPRIRVSSDILSDSTISYYIKRDEKAGLKWQDLSGAGGLQTGRFNIFLVHFKPDGSFIVY